MRVANVFVSYARGDRERIHPLVSALEAEGLSVWWDPALVPGRRFREMIAHELTIADAVVVVWTRQALESDWVQDEAEEARQRGVLIPVMLEPVKAPAGFRQVQSADLSQWTGAREHPEFRALCLAAKGLVAMAADDARRTQTADEAVVTPTPAPPPPAPSPTPPPPPPIPTPPPAPDPRPQPISAPTPTPSPTPTSAPLTGGFADAVLRAMAKPAVWGGLTIVVLLALIVIRMTEDKNVTWQFVFTLVPVAAGLISGVLVKARPGEGAKIAPLFGAGAGLCAILYMVGKNPPNGTDIEALVIVPLVALIFIVGGYGVAVLLAFLAHRLMGFAPSMDRS